MSSLVSSAPIFYFRNSADQTRLAAWRTLLKDEGKKLVFTNGVFDIVHSGHAAYLEEARNLGDALIIGLNSDSSVRRLKGPNRPIQLEADRAALLAALRVTDAVVVFDNDTPLSAIEFVLPDVLAKGGDWALDKIVGREVVEKNGGQVLPLKFLEGYSTTGIVEKIIERYGR